jgi:hypothetical protein
MTTTMRTSEPWLQLAALVLHVVVILVLAGMTYGMASKGLDGWGFGFLLLTFVAFKPFTGKQFTDFLDTIS